VIDSIEVIGTQDEHLLSAIASQLSPSEDATSSVRLRVFLTGRPDAITDSQQICGFSKPQICLDEEAANADQLANEQAALHDTVVLILASLCPWFHCALYKFFWSYLHHNIGLSD